MVWSSPLTIIIIVIITAFAITGLNYLLHRNEKSRSGFRFDEFGRKRREPPRVVSTGAQFAYDAPDYIPFKGKIHAARLHPDKIIDYGQNYFAYDSAKKKVLVQSSAMPDGLLLNTKDILSYTMIRDGQMIAQGPGLQRNMASTYDATADGNEAGKGKALCSELKIIIKIKHKIFREVVMPYICFPIESAFAYSSALQAANEVAGILGNILMQSPASAKNMKTSLDS